MARLIGFAGLVCVLTVGCGSTTALPSCDDDAFRTQDEVLYVAQATAQNAGTGGADVAVLVSDLRAGATALERHLESHAPCSPGLKELAARERAAVQGLRNGADSLEAGRGDAARSSLTALAAELGDIQLELAPSAG